MDLWSGRCRAREKHETCIKGPACGPKFRSARHHPEGVAASGHDFLRTWDWVTRRRSISRLERREMDSAGARVRWTENRLVVKVRDEHDREIILGPSQAAQKHFWKASFSVFRYN